MVGEIDQLFWAVRRLDIKALINRYLKALEPF